MMCNSCVLFTTVSLNQREAQLSNRSCMNIHQHKTVLDPVEILQPQLHTCHLQIIQKRIYVHTYNMMITSANS